MRMFEPPFWHGDGGYMGGIRWWGGVYTANLVTNLIFADKVIHIAGNSYPHTLFRILRHILGNLISNHINIPRQPKQPRISKKNGAFAPFLSLCRVPILRPLQTAQTTCVPFVQPNRTFLCPLCLHR